MRRLLAIAVLLAAACGGRPAAAAEDNDLDLIPAAASTPAPSGPLVARQGRLAWETAAGFAAYRNGLTVPLPAGSPRSNTDVRSSLDVRLQDDWTDRWAASFSDRADGRWQDDIDLPSHRMLVNNLREAYVTFEALPRTYLEAGRINQRNGIALGFNPTDFFRAGSQVTQASSDPQALRENRLGTFMLRGQTLWEGGSASLLLAPKLADATAIGDGTDGGLTLGTGRTNDQHRLELVLAQEVWALSPQFLIYHEADRTRFGLNLSRPVGQSIILYAEWAGGNRMDGAAEAIAYGRRTGTLPAALPLPAYADGRAGFQNDVNLGLSWTWNGQVSVNAELIEHQAGFSRRDWNAWQASGGAAGQALAWYVRAYAADRQVPMGQRELFLRAAWTDAFVRHLELAALAFVAPDDRSWQGQVSAAWDLSERWSVGAYLSVTHGDRRSEYGSLAGDGTLTLQAVRYF